MLVDYLLSASNVLIHANDLPRALVYAKRAIALAGDTPSAIGPTTIAARCLYILGHHHQTLHLVEQALSTAEKFGLAKGRNHILMLLARAMVLEDWGRNMEALADLQHAYTIITDDDDCLGMDDEIRGNLQSKLAGAYESAGMMSEAVKLDKEQVKQAGTITSSSAYRLSVYMLSLGLSEVAEENLRMQVAAMETSGYVPCSSDLRVLRLLSVCLETKRGDRATEEARYFRALSETRRGAIEDRRAALLEATRAYLVSEREQKGAVDDRDDLDESELDSIEARLLDLYDEDAGLPTINEEVRRECSMCSADGRITMMVTLVCGHCYHGHCLDLWASKCREKGITRSCPMCQGPLTRV